MKFIICLRGFNLIEVCGLPGSGKTTLISRLATYDHSLFDHVAIHFGKVSFSRKLLVLLNPLASMTLALFVLRYLNVFTPKIYNNNFSYKLKRYIKVFRLLFVCRQKNMCSSKRVMQEGVLHLIHVQPANFDVFWRDLSRCYAVNTISVVFLDLCPDIAYSQLCSREEIDNSDVTAKLKYESSFQAMHSFFKSGRDCGILFYGKDYFAVQGQSRENDEELLNKMFENILV